MTSERATPDPSSSERDELRRRVEEYQMIFDAMPIMLWFKDTENRCLRVNRAAAAFEGARPEDLTGRSAWDLYPKEQADAFYRDDLEVIRSGKPKLGIVERHTAIGTGELRWVEVGKVPTRAPDGTVSGVIAFAVDVTERARAEEALRRSEENLAITLQSIGDAVIATDALGRVTRVNRVAEELLRWPAREALGRRLDEVYQALDPESRAPLEEPAGRVVQGESGLGTERRALLVGRDGRERLVAESASPIRDERGETRGAVLVFRDVTEQARLEDQFRHAQKMESVGRLAGGIAHDFNNLLVGIRGFAEFLRRRVEDERQRGYVDRILDAANRAAELTSQLLAFSRKGKTSAEPVDAHGAVRAVLAIAERTFDPRISLEARLDASAPTILGDAAQVQSALLNLAVNARDAMPDGGKLVFSTRDALLDGRSPLSHSRPLEPGRYVEVSVQDSGVGMSKDVAAHAFEPFYTTKPVGEGTGLGLAAVYGTVRDHKGGIHVVTEPGRGTTVRLYLPESGEPVRSLAVPTPTGTPVRGSGVVLVVDDEPTVRALAQETLAEAGYEVLLAEDGEQAVATFRRERERVGLVLLDVVMPKMSGPDAFRAMRAIEPAVRVLMTSGYSFDASATALRDEGVIGFLQKPYSPRELARRVGELMGAGTVAPGRS